MKKLSVEEVICNHLRVFDFNVLSGPNSMHALHYAVKSSNFKAIEKLRKISIVEGIDFFVRDGTCHEMAQDQAAPSAAIYKMMIKIQANILERRHYVYRKEKYPPYQVVRNL